GSAAEDNLVDTPENKPKPRRAPRRKPAPKAETSEPAKDNSGDQPEAAE
ncbi:MAG TPA: DUF4167 domain-containing protein, partial [Sulfitobacter sp.]|nr:DUF4167 domain-containing protein [Sulfitobacter sp.]